MSLQDLIRNARENFKECAAADVQGRPDEVKERLENILLLVAAFLAEPDTAKAWDVNEADKQAKPGHSEPETPKEEPENNVEVPTPPGRCVPDELNKGSADTQEKQKELGDNKTNETDAKDG